MAFAVLFLASCSSSPQYADQEAHEKTEQLRQQYTPLITGTWHMQYVKDKRRFFERLTFNEDGSVTFTVTKEKHEEMMAEMELVLHLYTKCL